MKITSATVVVMAAFAASMPVHAADAPYGPQPSASAEALEPVLVTGSRIRRTAVEGPAPVTMITAEDIRNNGYATVSDVMSALTQNLGALDNNQNTDGFSPGAQSVDLRGLGPNHTLVLVNGRRIADYPQSYQGNSNFTDISNIPTSLIDHIEILSGSASAVYGSDAIAGVINFILVKKADGTTVDFRVGDTQHGGGASQRFQVSSGYSNDRFDSVFAVELFNQDPLWAYQRDFTNSRLDSPGDPSDIAASPVFARYDVNGNFIDPGPATCAALANYDMHSIVYATQQGVGNYCGSYRDVGYGTLENGRKAINLYGSATYHLNDNASLFLDLQAGGSDQILYNTPLEWQSSYLLDDNQTPTAFFNTATGQIEQWQRRYFTIEENGGFENGEIHNHDRTISLNGGLKGTFTDPGWDYELALGYAQNTLESDEPALIAAKAQALYLGPSLGIDPASLLNEYYAPISRLYTPLTVAQFQSITQDSVDNDTSRSSTVTFTTSNSKLFNLPAGPVGFAGVAEYGTQSFDQHVDPDSLNGTYYGLHNTSAIGSRSHFGVGAEFSAPVTSQLVAHGATRYDSYSYSGSTSGKFTFQTGLEYRPVNSLLLRASYGTGFRAPDLSFVYSGPSGSSSGGTDYYLCRKLQPQTGPDFFDNCQFGDVSFDGRSIGSTALKDETSRSLTYGLVFAPFKNLEISADYYLIRLANEVEYQSSDTILREEADCRLGVTQGGAAVDSSSGLCQSVESQVVRNPANAAFNPNGITSVLVLPINAAVDRTSGIDINARYHLSAGAAGSFDFKFGFTDVLTHTIQLFPGDPVDNELTDYFDYVIPRYKGSYSGTWNIGRISATLHGSLLGGLPNFDGTARLPSTTRYNGSLSYRFNDRGTLTFIVDNLFDARPQQDPTWTEYPYYASNWFDPTGRAFFVQFNYRIGGQNH
jgi:iron complex outermembrane recepter protein